MKYELAIDRAGLVRTVRQRYDLPVEDLAFVPVGYATACYRLRGPGRTRYFLKLWPDTRTGRAVAGRQDTILPLLRALHERVPGLRVPFPIPTRDGALSASFAKRPFAVFPFLPGHSPPGWPDWHVPLLEEMARTLATIHRATPALGDVLPPREDFAVPFEADLRRGLEEIERIGPPARPGLLALRDLVLPRRDDILTQLTRLHHLRQAVSRLSDPFVLCHTDFGGDNLLVDEHDRLAVVDWDNATVAPPEHNLQALLGDGFARALRAYREAGGTTSLHFDHFAYYLLRRYLEDMAPCLLRVLHEPSSAQEDDENLAGMVTWGFAQWAALDDTLATIATALQQRTP